MVDEEAPGTAIEPGGSPGGKDPMEDSAGDATGERPEAPGVTTSMDQDGSIEDANACEVTWIAAVRIGSRLVHMAVDTGASSTILRYETFIKAVPRNAVRA